MSATAANIPRHDATLLGLLTGAWAVAFLALFGVEARSLFYIHNQGWLLLAFPVLLAVLPFIARRELVRRIARAKVPVQGRRSIRRPQEPAHPITGDYVLRRAKEVGIADKIVVVQKPNSGAETNACVWAARGVQFLSVTSKAEGLLGAGRRGDMARMHEFQFLIGSRARSYLASRHRYAASPAPSSGAR
jgi:hypothetical protein